VCVGVCGSVCDDEESRGSNGEWMKLQSITLDPTDWIQQTVAHLIMKNNFLARLGMAGVCVSVCGRERERECVCVCVCVLTYEK